MSAFTGPLIIEEIVPGRRWRLVQPITFEADRRGSCDVIAVPGGFECDGATIPPLLRVFLAVWGTYGRAAALHDYLYSILRGRLLWWGDDVHPAFAAWLAAAPAYVQPGSNHAAARAWADRQFFLAMRACGTGRALALLMWLAVRLFAASAARPEPDDSEMQHRVYAALWGEQRGGSDG